ncbi:MAG TPA: NUDIX domain-containing protein [Glycomyces sp.]|nr:NUDIX domain-containing protein [Glycomyces sp.]
MPTLPEMLDFRQRASAYVLRNSAAKGLEVLVMLHRDSREAGVQIPGGGAHAHETLGETAVREAMEETGVRELVFAEVLSSKLMRISRGGGLQVNTYSWLRTGDARDAWDHTVVSADEDNGLRMRCEFRPIASAGIDWGMDVFLRKAEERFAAMSASAESAITFV